MDCRVNLYRTQVNTHMHAQGDTHTESMQMHTHRQHIQRKHTSIDTHRDTHTDTHKDTHTITHTNNTERNRMKRVDTHLHVVYVAMDCRVGLKTRELHRGIVETFGGFVSHTG